jgi:hypothetical protein
MNTKIKLEKIQIPPLGCHLVLTVYINQEATRLVLDTGASRSVIDKAYLESLLPKLIFNDESNESAGVGAADLLSYTTNILEFRIGNMKINNIQLACMDLEHVKSSYLKIEEDLIYGVIGGDILEKYNAVINYKDLELTLQNSPIEQ